MFKVVATLLATAALLTTGCGRVAPLTATQLQARAVAAKTTTASELSVLMGQATRLMHAKYPNAMIYELAGTRSEANGDPTDYDTWTFKAMDDTTDPKNTVIVTFKNNQFAAPVLAKGLDYGRRLSDVTPRISVRQAMTALRQASFNQDFRYIELYRVISPGATQPYYVFSSQSAIVTVGAEDGSVHQEARHDAASAQQLLPAGSY